MLSQRYRNNIGGSYRSEYTPVEVKIFGGAGDSDTFITNSALSETRVFDSISKQFTVLPQSEDGELLLRHRDYTKIGLIGDTKYRTVLFFHPSQAINQEIGSASYGIDRAILSLYTDATSELEFEAKLIRFGSSIDPSVSWFKPTELSETHWIEEGGDFEQSLSQYATVGRISEGKLSFDITSQCHLWQTSGANQLALVIKSSESEQGTVQFHSWEHREGFLGDELLKNCKFLSAGDRNSIKTEGVYVQMTESGQNVLVTQQESSSDRLKQFYSAQFSISVGSTLEMFDPDTNNSVSMGSKICTVVDRPSADSVLLSGFTLPNGITTHNTSVEFASESTIPFGSYVLEIEHPSDETKTEAAALVPEQKLKIRYYTQAQVNNSKDFTVAMVSDETRHKDRIRIFLNESTVSENRTGLDTEISTADTKPSLTLSLNVY